MVSMEAAPPVIGEAGSVGVRHEDDTVTAGWPTPSRKLEVYSSAMKQWGWPEHATPGYIRSTSPAARSTSLPVISCWCRRSGCPH
jgi:hypothetical protein